MSRKKKITYSAIIPVYNSERIVGVTISETIKFFNKHRFNYELIIINDGSSDKSWDILKNIASKNTRIKAINLLRNYGQHTAVYCGLQKSTGDYVITLDDDMQNPPNEIIHLINKANENYDVVFGKYRIKKQSLYRRLGSFIVNSINKKIFDIPDGIVTTNFRIIRRDVVSRVCEYKTNYPYVQGLIMMCSSNPANVLVKHKARKIGNSNYNIIKITTLVARILFNYSSYPLRLTSIIGILFSILSFILGIYYFLRAIILGSSVPGWATIAVMISFFDGITLLMLGMLGEYTIRLLNQVSLRKSYYIKEEVN